MLAVSRESQLLFEIQGVVSDRLSTVQVDPVYFSCKDHSDPYAFLSVKRQLLEAASLSDSKCEPVSS